MEVREIERGRKRYIYPVGGGQISIFLQDEAARGNYPGNDEITF
jgi:hypothetical protein